MATEKDIEAAQLAQKMAKVAGKQKASTMARAAYMLLCTAALIGDENAYFQWLGNVKALEAAKERT